MDDTTGPSGCTMSSRDGGTSSLAFDPAPDAQARGQLLPVTASDLLPVTTVPSPSSRRAPRSGCRRHITRSRELSDQLPSCARCAELRTAAASGVQVPPDRDIRTLGSMLGRDALICSAGVFDLSQEFDRYRLLDRTGELSSAAGPPSVQNRDTWRRVLSRARPQCLGEFTRL